MFLKRIVFELSVNRIQFTNLEKQKGQTSKNTMFYRSFCISGAPLSKGMAVGELKQNTIRSFNRKIMLHSRLFFFKQLCGKIKLTKGRGYARKQREGRVEKEKEIGKRRNPGLISRRG